MTFSVTKSMTILRLRAWHFSFNNMAFYYLEGARFIINMMGVYY